MSSGAMRKTLPSETGTRAISILGSHSIQQFGRMTPSVADCSRCVGDVIRIKRGCKERIGRQVSNGTRATEGLPGLRSCLRGTRVARRELRQQPLGAAQDGSDIVSFDSALVGTRIGRGVIRLLTIAHTRMAMGVQTARKAANLFSLNAAAKFPVKASFQARSPPHSGHATPKSIWTGQAVHTLTWGSRRSSAVAPTP